MSKVPSLHDRSSPPEPPGAWFLGHLPAMRRDTLGFLLDASRRYGDTFTFRVPGGRYLVFANPSHVRSILQDNHSSFQKSRRYTATMAQVLGQGLISNNGESHLRRRQIVQPIFRHDRVESFADAMIDAANVTVERWTTAAAHGRLVDIRQEMSDLTRRVVLRTLFGEDLANHASADIAASIEELNWQLNEDILAPLSVPRWVPTPRNRRFNRARNAVEKNLSAIIQSKDRATRQGADLVSALIRAVSSTDAAKDPFLLRDETLTLFVAGHETTANALTWTWHLLSDHPAVGATMRQELRRELGEGPATLSSLARLTYTRMVIEESLRLYPPAYMFDREVIADHVKVGEVKLARGSIVYLSPFLTHRLDEIWERPDEFYPEHFTAERVAIRPRYAYFPFGGGPRHCIGSNFAVLEMEILLATLAQRFDLARVSPAWPKPEPCITLRPPADVLMEVRSPSS